MYYIIFITKIKAKNIRIFNSMYYIKFAIKIIKSKSNLYIKVDYFFIYLHFG